MASFPVLFSAAAASGMDAEEDVESDIEPLRADLLWLLIAVICADLLFVGHHKLHK